MHRLPSASQCIPNAVPNACTGGSFDGMQMYFKCTLGCTVFSVQCDVCNLLLGTSKPW